MERVSIERGRGLARPFGVAVWNAVWSCTATANYGKKELLVVDSQGQVAQEKGSDMKETRTFDDWVFRGETFAEHAKMMELRGRGAYVYSKTTATPIRVTITVESLEQDKP